MCLASAGSRSEKLATKYEAALGWVLDEKDHIQERVDEAVAEIEAICQPVLEIRAGQTSQSARGRLPAVPAG
jgi:hypothetical protein